MARSKLTAAGDDLVTDGGNVLFSFVQGEQLEHPVTLNFLDDPTLYTYEAVIVESLNAVQQTEPPVSIRPSGVQSTLTVRIPVNRGDWLSVTAYNAGEIVRYNSVYYVLLQGTAYTNTTPPSSDTKWQATVRNKIYIQFPSTMGTGWAVQPDISYSVYGFFELRVSENVGVFPRTWKPVRGLVELLFSPTELVT